MARGSNAAKVNVWSERLERFQRSRLTVARFCEAEGVSQASFYLWRKKLSNRCESTGKLKVARSKFQAVEVSTPLVQSEQRATTIRLAEGVEIELGSDLRIVDQVVESIVKQLCEMRLRNASAGSPPMLSFSSDLNIFAYTQATDMRKGCNGLSGIVRSEFQADPTDGSLFIFINRRRDRMKLLHFDGGGYWLYYRLLEAGTFEELQATDESCQLQIDATQLSMLLSGVSLVAAKNRRKRYSDQAA